MSTSAYEIQDWIPVTERVPDTPRCVLATDLEGHVVACFENDQWIAANNEEELDTHITHWQELTFPDDT